MIAAKSSRPVSSGAAEFLSGGGEMGALIRAKDWSGTPVGAAEQWPQSLRTALGILLDSGYAMYIVWGPEFTRFYSDAYRPMLGQTKQSLDSSDAYIQHPLHQALLAWLKPLINAIELDLPG